MALTKFAKQFLKKHGRGNLNGRSPNKKHPYKTGIANLPKLKKKKPNPWHSFKLTPKDSLGSKSPIFTLKHKKIRNKVNRNKKGSIMNNFHNTAEAKEE